jgi:hypothetical protein
MVGGAARRAGWLVPLGDGSAPHGVVVGPDRAPWVTGQAGVLGRLDPKAGRVEVFDALRGPGPYGITTTPDGQLFYASLAGSHIGRIDHRTGAAEVLEPPTADQGARRVWSDSRGRMRCGGPSPAWTSSSWSAPARPTAQPPGLRCLGTADRIANYFRMFTTCAMTSPISTSETDDCNTIVILAQRLNGMVSVGLNAVALVNAR